jgi:biotin carboxylase
MDRILLILPTTTYRAQAFMEAASSLNIEVVVGSEKRQALAGLVPGTTLDFDLHKSESALKKIVKYAREKPFKAIIGVDEETVVLAAKASEALALPYNPLPAVRATRDKYEMRRKLARGGLSSPEAWLFSADQNLKEISKRVNYPCVLKPTFLSASRGVIRANDKREFVQAFSEIVDLLSDRKTARQGGESAKQILVEDYIQGNEVAVEGILLDRKLKLLALFDKPDPLQGPYFQETIYTTPSRLPSKLQEEIVNITQKAANAIGLHIGPLHAELRFNDSGIYPVEIAARSIGGCCSKLLRFNNGISLEELILRHALGQDIRRFEREELAAGVMMIPTPQAGILKKVKGIDAARAVAGVEDIIVSIPLGQKVEVLPRGSRYLGFIFVRGETAESVEGAIRAAHARLEIVIE